MVWAKINKREEQRKTKELYQLTIMFAFELRVVCLGSPPPPAEEEEADRLEPDLPPTTYYIKIKNSNLHADLSYNCLGGMGDRS